MEVIHDKNNKEFKIELDKSSNDKGIIFYFLNNNNTNLFSYLLAYLTYELQGDTIDFQHTFVPSQYRGQGLAEKLVQVIYYIQINIELLLLFFIRML